MPRHLPSRDEVLTLLRDENRPLSATEVATALNVPPTSERGLVRLLDNLVLNGDLEGHENERFSLVRADRPKGPTPAAPLAAKHAEPTHSHQARSHKREAAPPARRDKDRHQKKSLPTRAERRGGGAPVRHDAATEDAPVARTSSAGDARPARASGLEEREGLLSIAARGFGFVGATGPTGDDVYVAKESIGGGMHGDRVRVAIVRRTARGLEGEIVAIIERKNKRVAGTLRRRGKSAWLEPDDARLRSPIPLPAEIDTRAGEGNSGNDGDAAVVSITRFPELPDELPEGKLEAVLGRPGELNVEVAKILVREQIEELHGERAVREAEDYGPTVPVQMLEGREDLTHIPLPTIDPEDARDHDDAVWVERTKHGGYRAYVAIADVSSYVVPGTQLDAEAMARGCSIYLPDRAIPMLPRALSSNLCSLLPDVVRLCLCMEAEINAAGDVVRSRIIRGFMKSAAKLTYGSVARALKLSDVPPVDPKAEAMVDGLRVAYELSRILREKRMKRGALDLDLPEAKIALGEGGHPTAIGRRADDQGVRKAYQLIEELMLLANEVVARWFQEKNLPTVYRVHAPPDEQKLERFARLTEALGIEFEVEDAQDPKKVSELLKGFADHPQANVLRMLLLRSLKQATYDVVNIGHFGLASKAYLHFTSPIRRYPDLLVHRGTHAVVLGKRRPPSEQEMLAEAAKRSSENERRAMDIEREVVDIYRCVFMRDRIGERYEGTVTGLVGTGAYVMLDDPFVDVMVRFEDLGDRYELDDDGISAVSERTRDVIRLGDRMMVEILDAAIVRRTVYAKRIGHTTTGKDGRKDLSRRERRGGEKSRGRADRFGGKSDNRKTDSRKDKNGKAAHASSKKGKSKGPKRGKRR